MLNLYVFPKSTEFYQSRKLMTFLCHLKLGFKIPVKAENSKFKTSVDTLQPNMCGCMSKLQNHWLF